MTDPSVSIDGVVDTITTTLLRRAKSDDEAAWERMFQIYSPLSYCWARRRGLAPEDSRDVVQEVFLKVQRKLAEFDRSEPGQTFRGWLRVITENTIRDFARKQKKHDMAAGGSEVNEAMRNLPDDNVDSDDLTPSEEVAILYRQVIGLIRSEFSDVQWNCFWEVVVESRSPAEVAESLGVTRNQVYLAKSRIIGRVNQLIEETD